MNIDDPALTLRPATALDQPFLAALYRSTRDDLLQLGLPEPMLANLLQMQYSAQQSGYRNQFSDADHAIIEKQGAPMGYLVTHRGEASIRLVYIALLPTERNKGHGKNLLRALQTEAASAHKTLALTVDILNAPARHVYHAAGFRITGEDGGNILMNWP